MLVPVVTTNIPNLVGADLAPFHVRELREYGFWSMAHESRADFATLLGSIFPLLVGADPWSPDAKLARRSVDRGPQMW